MKAHRCSRCSMFVKPEDFNSHASMHLQQAQGIDQSGNVVPSRESVDFYQVEVPDENSTN